MYSDVIKKINFQKERIIKSFIEKGICPSNDMVNEKLNKIDSYMALFKHYDKITGNKFDVNEYNEALKLIYKDITIIYEILFDELEREYTNNQAFIQAHLTELDTIVDSCYIRAVNEATSTTIGHSALFKNSGFTAEINNDITTIDLGTVNIHEGSSVACIIDAENCNYENVVFEFINDEEIIDGPSYNRFNETIKFPGNKIKNEHSFTIGEDQNSMPPIMIPIESSVVPENNYTILCDKGKISAGKEIVTVPKHIEEYRFEEACHINFYILNGKSATFKFNKKPLSANFPLEEDIVTNMSDIQHFFIDAPKDFQFSIEIDKGEIYAINEKGVVNNGKLYYVGKNNVKDFLVIEEEKGKKISWDCRIKIIDNDSDSINIKSIVIKELK